MDQLLPYYERELVQFRLYCSEFASRFPRVAGNLQMTADSCGDPHVERLIEAFSLIAARVMKRLDDDYPQLTEAFLETLYPHYLRQFASCAIVRRSGSGSQPMALLARGTELATRPVDGVRCRFRTVYEVAPAPVRLSAARFDAVFDAPASLRVPVEVTSGIALEFDCEQDLPAHGLAPLRVFIDGEPSFCAALRDTLFMRTACALVEPDGGAWRPMSEVPLAAVGFGDDDGLIPFAARSHAAYRLLTEYFTFPEKFNFFDVDLAMLAARLPPGCRKFTLHLAAIGLRADGNLARLLGSLSANNLLLGCTPVINLFRKSAVPIAVTQQASGYAVVADANHARAFEVHTVESVDVLRRSPGGDRITEFRPFYSLRHADPQGTHGHYWIMRRDAALAVKSPGYEYAISFVDVDCSPLALEQATASLALTCSNRDLPARLPYGAPGGDLSLMQDSSSHPFTFVRKPTPQFRFEAGYGAQWRLISHLTLNHHSLVQQGLQSFREMLALYDLPRSMSSQRQIAGIVGLSNAPATAWLRDRRGASLVHGIEVRIVLAEEAFVGSGMHLFVQVLDRFLGLYVHLNAFIELVAVSSTSGEELIRCKPRNGDLNLV